MAADSCDDLIAERCIVRGKPLWSLLPTDAPKWAKLLEDVLGFPRITNEHQELLATCLLHKELSHISFDGTM